MGRHYGRPTLSKGWHGRSGFARGHPQSQTGPVESSRALAELDVQRKRRGKNRAAGTWALRWLRWLRGSSPSESTWVHGWPNGQGASKGLRNVRPRRARDVGRIQTVVAAEGAKRTVENCPRDHLSPLRAISKRCGKNRAAGTGSFGRLRRVWGSSPS